MRRKTKTKKNKFSREQLNAQLKVLSNQCFFTKMKYKYITEE